MSAIAVNGIPHAASISRITPSASAGAESVAHEQHFVVVLFKYPRDVSSERDRAAVVSADIDHRMIIRAVNDRVHFGRQRRKIDVGVRKLGGYQVYPCRRKLLCAVLRAKVRIHHIEIGDQHLVEQTAQIHCVIHRDIRLAAAVVTGKKRYTFGFHNLFLCIFPLVVFGSSFLNSTIRGYLYGAVCSFT